MPRLMAHGRPHVPCVLLLALVLACSLVPLRVARAADAGELGQLVLNLTNDAQGSAEPMSDGHVAIFCVAVARYGPDARFDATGGLFAQEAEVADITGAIGGLDSDGLDEHNQEFATRLEEVAARRGIVPTAHGGIVDGGLRFSGLSQGLYLVTQVKPSAGDLVISPFLVSIPDGEGNARVVATPKSGVFSIGDSGRRSIWSEYPPIWLNISGDDVDPMDTDKPSQPDTTDKSDTTDKPREPAGPSTTGDVDGDGNVDPYDAIVSWYRHLFDRRVPVSPYGDPHVRTTTDTTTTTGTDTTTNTTTNTTTGTTADATAGRVPTQVPGGATPYEGGDATTSTSIPTSPQTGADPQAPVPSQTRVEVPVTTVVSPSGAGGVTQRVPQTADASVGAAGVLVGGLCSLGVAFALKWKWGQS